LSRTFVIGDIHGALKALQQLIAKINPSTGDTLVFLGDYVDGWPDSAQVVNFLIELEQQCKCIFIKGNHDILCESWLQGKLSKTDWVLRKGKSTIESYGRLDDSMRQKHLYFFSRLYLFHIDEQNRLYIHAGFKNNEGPQFEFPETNLTVDRSLWELAMTMDKRVRAQPSLYPKKLLLFNQIFIGHTPTLINDVMAPMHACNVWNLDTGAGYFGKLSALEVDSLQVVQSDVVTELYPEHTGKDLSTK